MFKNFYSFLYKFDLIGASPQLLIFNNTRYKTVFSSITSIIIIIFSIVFSVASLIDYLKYENPIVVYYKDNDIQTKRELLIKDSLMMFQLIETKNNSNIISNSIAYYERDYSIMYDNGTYLNTPIEIEKGEFGKNIDLRYQKFFENKYTFGWEVKDFYCISNKNQNISLFYYPKIGYSYLNLYIVFKDNKDYIPENMRFLIVSQSDLIDHNKKDNPIQQDFDYHISAAFNSFGFNTIKFYFQYIKYESDDGFFYKNSKIMNGISFKDLTYFMNAEDDSNNTNKYLNYSRIGVIEMSINKSNFEYYKRTYLRLQSLLADIMSVISLIFEIAKQISSILCYKKMSKDIIRKILNKNDDYISYY